MSSNANKATTKAKRTARKAKESHTVVPDISAASEDQRIYSHRYAHQCCRNVLERLECAMPDKRHFHFMKATTVIGGWEAARCITSREAEAYIARAIDIMTRKLGPDEKIFRQANKGRLDGLSNPFAIPKAPRWKEIEEYDQIHDGEVDRDLLEGNGEEVNGHEILMELAEGTTITRVDWFPSKDLIPGGRAEKKTPSNSTITRLKALVAKYESNSTLWVFHKKWLTSPVIRELLKDAFREKRVTRYPGVEFMFRIAFSNCTRLVIGNLGKRDCPCKMQKFISGREAIILSERLVPLDWRKWETSPVDIDLVAKELLGIDPSGAKGIKMRLRETVRRCGFAIPSASMAGYAVVKVSQTGHGREFPHLVTEAMLSLAYLKTSTPGRPHLVAYEAMRAPSAQTLADYLQYTGKRPSWIEWLGQRLELRDARGEFLSLLPGLSSEDLNAESLSTRMGVSVGTFWRRLNAAELTMEHLRELWEKAAANMAEEKTSMEAC